MLGEAPAIVTVADRLAAWKAERVVLDPVMVAKSGDALLASAAVGALREALVPLAHVITPNLPEAGVLLESRAPESVKEMTRAAERLHRLMGSGERWVWLKGGHLPGGDATDLLFNGDRMIEISRPRVETKNTHGTGCTLSAALAALLPQRPDVPTAAQRREGLPDRGVAAGGRAADRARARTGASLPRTLARGEEPPALRLNLTGWALSEDNSRPRRISSAG